MNEEKLDALFAAARRLPPPVPEPGFENLVLAAVRAEAGQGRGRSVGTSWLAALETLFPRLAWAAATLILVCVAAESGASALGVPSLTDGLAQLSDQWLLTANGF